MTSQWEGGGGGAGAWAAPPRAAPDARRPASRRWCLLTPVAKPGP